MGPKTARRSPPQSVSPVAAGRRPKIARAFHAGTAMLGATGPPVLCKVLESWVPRALRVMAGRWAFCASLASRGRFGLVAHPRGGVLAKRNRRSSTAPSGAFTKRIRPPSAVPPIGALSGDLPRRRTAKKGSTGVAAPSNGGVPAERRPLAGRGGVRGMLAPRS